MDLGSQLKVLQHLAENSLGSHIVLLSETRKAIVMLELTVPWAECMEEAHEWKKGKYDALSVTSTGKAGRQGPCQWRLGVDALQDSLCRAYMALGITGERRMRAIYNNTEVAKKASGCRGKIHDQALLGHKLMPDQIQLGCLSKGV